MDTYVPPHRDYAYVDYSCAVEQIVATDMWQNRRSFVDSLMEMLTRMQIAREIPAGDIEELTLISADGQPDAFRPTDTLVRYTYRAVLSHSSPLPRRC